MEVEEQAKVEGIRCFTGGSFNEGLVVNGTRNVENLVKLRQQVETVELTERDQGAGINENDSQDRSAELFGEGGVAEDRFQASGIGVPGKLRARHACLFHGRSERELALRVEIEDPINLAFP